MTKTNKLRIKLSALSLSLTYATYLLAMLAKNGNGMESAIGQLGAMVVGTLTVGFLIATIVYIFVEDN